MIEITKLRKTNFNYLQKIKGLSKLNVLDTISKRILIIMDFRNGGSTSTTLDFLSFCSNKTTSPSSSVVLGGLDIPGEHNTDLHNRTLEAVYPHLEFPSYRPWLDVETTKDCDEMLHDFLYEMDDRTTDNNFDGDQTEESPEEFISSIFFNGTYNYSANIRHTRCIAMETEVLQLIEEPLVRAKEAWRIIWLNLTTAETIQEAQVFAEKLAGYYGDVINNGLLRHKYYNKMEEYSTWIVEFIDEDLALLVGSEQEEIAGEIRKKMRKILDTMRIDYSKMYENYITSVHPNIENLRRYLNRNMTKMELSQNLSQISFIKSTEILYWQNADILSSIKKYTTNMTLAKEILMKICSALVSLKLPILNKYIVYELELVKYSGDLDDSRMRELVDSLKSDVTHLPQLVAECYNRLIKSVEEMTNALVKPIDDVLEQ